MSERDDLDRQIRARLQDVVTGPGPVDDRARLDDTVVRGRARRRNRAAAARVAAVVVVVAVAVGAFQVLRTTRGSSTSAPPAASVELLGTFTAVVPAAGGSTPSFGGRWSLTFHGDGTTGVRAPAGYQGIVSGVDYQAAGTRLRVNLFAQDACSADPVGTYRWSRDDTGLHFFVVADACPDRVHVLTAGVWRPGL